MAFLVYSQSNTHGTLTPIRFRRGTGFVFFAAAVGVRNGAESTNRIDLHGLACALETLVPDASKLLRTLTALVPRAEVDGLELTRLVCHGAERSAQIRKRAVRHDRSAYGFARSARYVG